MPRAVFRRAGQASLGAMITRLRAARELSQLEMAERLCEVSGMATITRSEVSRWEREARLPSDFWLRWVAEVLDVPLAELKQARAMSKGDIDMQQMGTNSGNGNGRAGSTATAGGGRSRSFACAGQEECPATVQLSFRHRQTEVQLDATYEQAEHATFAIALFRCMVLAGQGAGAYPAAPDDAAGTDSRSRGQQTADGLNGSVPGSAPSGARQRVPMGIRYLSGPGVGNPSSGSGGSSSNGTGLSGGEGRSPGGATGTDNGRPQ